MKRAAFWAAVVYQAPRRMNKSKIIAFLSFCVFGDAVQVALELILDLFISMHEPVVLSQVKLSAGRKR
jgi:hypothetical protein